LALLAVALYLHVSDALSVHVDLYGQTMRCRFAHMVVELGVGLLVGLLVGLIGTFWYGGLDLIQHLTLHLILWRKDYTPGNYARFLDYAAERVFLQKVGGGYIFIHRLLLEHFTQMNIEGKKVDNFHS
jgi:hypothetical protein